MNKPTMDKKLGFITATYRDGSIARLYGYPVHLDGETVGIVTGNSRKGFQGHVLKAGKVIEFYGYRTRKDAFAWVVDAVYNKTLEREERTGKPEGF